MRQLYQACVIPKLDYCSTVWYNQMKSKRHTTTLNTVQTVAVTRILSTFKVEAYLLPTRLRLRQRAQDVITNLLTLPKIHPICRVLERAIKGTVQAATGPQHPPVKAMKTFEQDQLEQVKVTDPCSVMPWRKPTFDAIVIEIGRAHV